MLCVRSLEMDIGPSGMGTSFGNGGFYFPRNDYTRIPIVERQMRYYKNRLDSFKYFPKRPFYPRPAELAAAGFYYLGYTDTTKCFSCGLSVHNWEETDDAISEHYRWSSGRCAFLHHITSFAKYV